MSVEAALLLPTALTLLALLVQPACVLYTRSAMASTAAELARAQLTSKASDDELVAYAERRLAAVPDLAVFHEGGEDGWEIELSGPTDAGRVVVSIRTDVRPLPFIGAAVWVMGTAQDGCVELAVEAAEDLRSSWIGGDYDDWIEIWG